MGRSQCVRALLALGAERDARMEGDCTPLHMAALEGCTRSLALLLDAGAAADARDRDGKSALHVAAEAGRWSCVTELLSRGADRAAESNVRACVRAFVATL